LSNFSRVALSISKRQASKKTTFCNVEAALYHQIFDEKAEWPEENSP
jgi:hypothetical protein